MNTVILQTRLWFCQGTSDKVYLVRLIKTIGGNFMLRAEWGRRGKSMQSQVKGVFASSLGQGEWDARRAFHKLVAEKTNKGYSVTEALTA